MATVQEYAEQAEQYAKDRGLSLGTACAEVAAQTDEVEASEIIREIRG